jgi:voltage-gated potassium channel
MEKPTTQDYQDAKKEFLSNRIKLKAASFLSLSVIAGGSIVYSKFENLGWVDAIYLSTITLTTVGYGDITPQTDFGKLFTAAYALLGIGLIAALANLIIKNVHLKREFKRLDKLKEKQRPLKKDQKNTN